MAVFDASVGAEVFGVPSAPNSPPVAGAVGVVVVVGVPDDVVADGKLKAGGAGFSADVAGVENKDPVACVVVVGVDAGPANNLVSHLLLLLDSSQLAYHHQCSQKASRAECWSGSLLAAPPNNTPPAAPVCCVDAVVSRAWKICRQRERWSEAL
ncbi:hypothetical protein CIHG_06807 [Coccidioides immitis H538.4]|uniref:Uncharacterized protein n=1 Tax=Coccidioides immitis H538.4 TaxID=396776 RepID=A0A0J8RW21_COCIT|nr:hypothetical protein CIHG_06807 [Coccidioides immitis H538.4]